MTWSIPSAVYAQSEPSDADAAAGASVLTTTTTSGALLVVGGIVLTVVLVTKDGKSSLRNYIRQNAVAMRHDLTIGGGETIADLGVLFDVPADRQRTFARALRAHRDDLMPLVTSNIDDDGTERFIEVVRGILTGAFAAG